MFLPSLYVPVLDAIADILRQDPRIAYALAFGSRVRGNARADSDLDLAVGTSSAPDARELGGLIGRLESASGLTVDLILLDEAPPGLAYRVFRDGQVILDRDRGALVARKARAVLEYLDFKPIEDLCAAGVLAVARRGR